MPDLYGHQAGACFYYAMTCESCGNEADELRIALFVAGVTLKVCRDCVEAWALEFGGEAAEALKGWPKP